jgi:hemerythrin-like domain-containing protein
MMACELSGLNACLAPLHFPTRAGVQREQSMADILNVLKAEHALLRGLFKRLDQTSDCSTRLRQQLLDLIESSLGPHSTWENAVFYPALAKRADSVGLKALAEAIEEHRILDVLVISDVRLTRLGTRSFAGNAKVFAELVNHHAKKEETTMFAEARRLFTKEERRQMADDYMSWKLCSSDATALVRKTVGN